MNKIEEIFRSFRIAFNPNDEQADLAAKRIEVCNECEFKSLFPTGPIFNIAKCSVCGCALRGKIFTPKTYLDEGGSCPKTKWSEIEKNWLAKKEVEKIWLAKLEEESKIDGIIEETEKNNQI